MATDARLLRALEDENAKLKKLLAEQMLDNAILRAVAAKNGSARRQALAVDRSSVRYRSVRPRRSPLARH
ncbi:hypothetical protein [Limimaricola cinnabarinus]|uniref:Mobile element protein n=1 Tax=Limimaricola cinnabarinus LL-001 TaxID=1337093 RepID=U3AMN8_9RHOB|nr:mobile element protein [Limimaricola cinnabarinus LL-001]